MRSNSKWYYSIYNPYGVHTQNTNGGQSNVLYRWSSKAARDDEVARDGGHNEAVPASNKYVKRYKALGNDEYIWPVLFLED